jgi:hypothetical protein
VGVAPAGGGGRAVAWVVEVVDDGRVLLEVLLKVLVVVLWPTVVAVVVVVLDVVGSRVVEVEGGAVVVVGRTVELGLGTARRRGRVVEEIPATRPRGRRVVGAAASLEGPSCRAASPDGPGAVTTPSTLPPVAPSTTATTSIAHRRSSLNRIHAPACASGFH